MSEIRKWQEAIGLGQYAEAFEANHIDMDLLCPKRRFAVDGNARSWKSANVARRPLSAGLRKSVRPGG